MALSELEQHIYAFYVAKGAADFNMDPRWWPRLELTSIVEDKLRFITSRFWLAGRPPVEAAAGAFLDQLIERGAFATKEGDRGQMYQFQRTPYQSFVAEIRDSNPIIAQAAAAEDADEFWDAAFDRLTR